MNVGKRIASPGWAVRRFLGGAILLAWLLPVASAQTGQKLEFDKVKPWATVLDVVDRSAGLNA